MTTDIKRRSLLKASVAGMAGAMLPLQALQARKAAGMAMAGTGYGPLIPAVDATTGLPLIALPKGFRYLTMGWVGSTMSDGVKTPIRHDGMAVVRQKGDELTLIRNHEITEGNGPFSTPEQAFDPVTGGGTTTLVFDQRREKLVRDFASLSGSLTNCAGGPTPWGSWLTCEEIVCDAGVEIDRYGKKFTPKYAHGYVFEVPAEGATTPKPIVDMGRFRHEAIAIDEANNIYLTEDRYGEAGFYRFVPHDREIPLSGGRLQMACVEGRSQMITGVEREKQYAIHWVDIAKPDQGHSPGTQDGAGVIMQGKAAGGTPFSRLEGCWHHQGMVYFTSTDGGDSKAGQVYALNVNQQTLSLVYESDDRELLDMPDNLTVSPRGGIVLCEDAKRTGNRLHGLSPQGEVFPFAQNMVQLNGEVNGLQGDYRGSEWCGACFSPDGKWLFANLQSPGLTVAITGPWQNGLL